MAKVRLSMNHAFFRCPGCKDSHNFRIKAPVNDPGAEVWTFNGDVDKPTFSPSLLLVDTTKPCHLYVSAEDAGAAGLLKWEGTGMHPIFVLTDKGKAVAARLRAHKGAGGNFADFEPGTI